MSRHVGGATVRSAGVIRRTVQRLARSLDRPVDQFASGHWTTDTELRMTSAHSPWMEAAGVDPSGLVGLRLWELAGDRNGLPAIVASRRALKGRQAPFAAWWAGRRWQGHVQPLRTVDGAIVGTIGFAMDASERQRATRELQDAEARFRGIFEQAAVGISLCDLTGQFVRVNPKVCEMLGYSAAELLGLTYQDLTPDDEVGANQELNDRLYAGEIGSFELEKRVLHRDGHPVSVRLTASAIRDANGRPLYGLGITEDITAQKAAEAALRDSLTQYRALFANARDGISILDDDACFVDVNPEACAIYGRSRAELIGRSRYEFEALPSGVPDQNAVGRPFLEAGEWQGEAQIGRPDGSVRQVEFSSCARFAPGLHLSFARDMTERRQLEAMLTQSQKLEAIGRLAGGVAHDFNNLLTAILGYAQLVAADPTTKHLQEELAAIQDAANRGADLTRQLLDFSRLQIIRPVPLDLNVVIEGLEPLLRRLIGEDIQLELDLRPVRPVRADPTQVGQVLLNLVVNARDAMPDGGVLRIATRPTPDDSTEAGARSRRAAAVSDGSTAHDKRSKRVQLVVSDSGTGMDAATVARIFEPFFTTKPDGAGTGLGLATVYGIVEQSRGTISVASMPGAGSTFTIELPASEPGEPVVNVRATAVAEIGGGRGAS